MLQLRMQQLLELRPSSRRDCGSAVGPRRDARRRHGPDGPSCGRPERGLRLLIVLRHLLE
jgi:hypothetical protein